MEFHKSTPGKVLITLFIASAFIYLTYSQKNSSSSSPSSMGSHHGMHGNLKMITPPKEAITLSESAIALAEIQVTPVQRRAIEGEVRLFGVVDFDETKVARITSWFPGRVEKMYLNYTGGKVRKGEKIAEIYSPSLVAAQEELIQSLKLVKNLSEEGKKQTYIQKKMIENLNSTREKLTLWGISKDEINEIETKQEVKDTLSIVAPISGIVIEKHVSEGNYLKQGMPIFTIGKLDVLWAKLDAYESDLSWLKEGQSVEFTAATLPGKTFEGVISFIDPTIDTRSRTSSVRVNISNKEGHLKPGVYLRGVVRPMVDRAPKTKTMHHQMHHKMAQKSHKTMTMPELPLVIPHTAPLITGKRAMVYVQVPEHPTSYVARQIRLGARLGSYYIVEDGLKEGEMVVTYGNFKLDSASQIMGKPSMMKPEGGSTPSMGHHHH